MTIHHTECEYCETELLIEVEEDDAGNGNVTYEECECIDARLDRNGYQLKIRLSEQRHRMKAFERAVSQLDIEAMRRTTRYMVENLERVQRLTEERSALMAEPA